MLSKKELRRRLIENRSNIPEDVRREKSLKIKEKLLQSPVLQQAERVFVYVSFGSEVQTHELINELIKMGKTVGVPLCNTETHTMSVKEITDFSQLIKGNYNILEPDSSLKEIPKDEIDLVIVPAAAFDSDGYRMGYGGGYYDRFLADFNGKSIGVAFSECITEALPKGKFDKKVNEVITDKA